MTNGKFIQVPVKPKRGKPVPPCNKKYKLYYKDGGATMLIARNMTYSGALFLSKFIKKYLEDHDTKLEGVFLSPKL